MAGLAKSPKANRVSIVKVKSNKEFIRKFNDSKPSREFFESCRRAGDLFGVKK